MLKRIFVVPVLLALSACSLMPAEQSAYSHFPAQAYVSAAHERQQADIYVPAGAGPFPAVMVIHGGSWTRGEPSDMQKYVERLVDDGYVVMNIAYRLAPEFRFPAQTQDVASAYAYLLNNAKTYKVDPKRVGVLGYSAGAHLALMLGLNAPQGLPAPAAIVAGGAPTDMTDYPDSPYLVNFIGGNLLEFPQEYVQASPLAYVSPDDPAVLLYHGKWDQLVDIEQSRKLATELQAQQVPMELIEMPLRGHITAFVFDGGAYKEIQSFLAKNL